MIARYHGEDAPTISAMQIMTRCAAATMRSRRAFRNAGAGRQSLSHRVGFAGPPRQVRQGRCTPNPCCRWTMPSATKMWRISSARVRRFLGLKEEDEVAVTAEPKIDGLVCHPCAMKKACLGASGATRGDGSGRRRHHRQLCAPSSDIPAAPEGQATRDVLEVRGEIYMTHTKASRSPEQAAGKRRQAGLCQSAQLRCRLGAPA